jgi:hypothetical protein
VGFCLAPVRQGPLTRNVDSSHRATTPAAPHRRTAQDHANIEIHPPAHERHERHDARPLALAIALSAASVAAQAQSSLKPGLWEQSGTLKSQSGQIEQAMAQAEAQIARLPAAQRRQIEAMMKERGVSIGNGTTTVRMCLTAQDIERGNIPVQTGECTQKVLSRDDTTLNVSFTCQTNPPSSGVGEVRLLSPTSTLATATVDTLVNDKPERIDTTQKGTWLGDDCGDVKPLPR